MSIDEREYMREQHRRLTCDETPENRFTLPEHEKEQRFWSTRIRLEKAHPTGRNQRKRPPEKFRLKYAIVFWAMLFGLLTWWFKRHFP